MKPITLLLATLVVVTPGCGKKKAAGEPPPAADDAGAPAADDRASGGKAMRDRAVFLVQISLTAGEEGRDSNATQTHVSLMDDQIFFAETPRGAFANKRPRLNVASTLTPAERTQLEQSIRDLGLFEVETIKTTKQPEGPHSYASVTVNLRLGGKEHEFTLSGVTSLPGAGATAFAETAGYKGVMRLVGEIETIARAK